MSTTLAAARQALGDELGGFFRGVAYSGTTTTIGTTIPAFYSTELPDDALAYAWAYLPSGSIPKLRRVTKTGVDGAFAVITVDAAFGTTVTNGTVFEISTRLPSTRDYSSGRGETTDLGLNEALNMAGRHLIVERDDMRVTLVTGQYDYGLTTWTWLDRPERLVDVREPNVDGQTFKTTRRVFELRENGSGATLHFDQPYRFTTGSHTIQIVGRCPADRYIKRGGSWIETTTGYLLESDEMALEVRPLVTTALVFCYRALMQLHKGAARARYEALYVRQLDEARQLRQYDHSQDIDPSTKTPAMAPAQVAA